MDASRLKRWEIAVNSHDVLSSGKADSFALKTMSTRIPALLDDILTHEKAQLSSDQCIALEKLAMAIRRNDPLPRLEENQKNQVWMEHFSSKYTWLNAPWFFSEAYFFRLILEYSGYYQTLYDPFTYLKDAELLQEKSWDTLSNSLASVNDRTDDRESFQTLIKSCLWGNKADGCYKEVRKMADAHSDSHSILVDHSDQVMDFVLQPEIQHIAFINDNCGLELFMDLALTDYLLRQNVVQEITFHLKMQPTYVSDAMITDVEQTIEHMKSQKTRVDIQQLGQRLDRYLNTEKRLHLQHHWFWCSCKFFWEFPADLQDLFKNIPFTFIKGDANYRRLLGDRDWPIQTPVEEAIPYFITSFVALRTLKSDPIVGVAKTHEDRLNRETPLWRVNGTCGIIQSCFILT